MLMLKFNAIVYVGIEIIRTKFAESDQGLTDTAMKDIRPEDFGRRGTILPSPFPGSPWHMREYAHDAPIYCRNF